MAYGMLIYWHVRPIEFPDGCKIKLITKNVHIYNRYYIIIIYGYILNRDRGISYR